MLETIIWIVVLSPLWGMLLWPIWTFDIRPRLIPAAEIEAITDALMERHGPHAGKRAFLEAVQAWYDSDPVMLG